MVVTLHAPGSLASTRSGCWPATQVSMISLGDLNAGHTGTFVIPPGTDLHNYSRIDISLQPFDGSTRRSKTSVVRGSLPTAGPRRHHLAALSTLRTRCIRRGLSLRMPAESRDRARPEWSGHANVQARGRHSHDGGPDHRPGDGHHHRRIGKYRPRAGQADRR